MNRKLLFLLCMAAVCFSAPRASAQYFSVGINAPMLASGTLNVTLEAAVAPHWSVELALLANPVSTERLGLTAAALQPGVRYWFLLRSMPDIFWRCTRLWRRTTCGMPRTATKDGFRGRDVSYGYCWPLSARWNMTLEGGIGIYHMRESENDASRPIRNPNISAITGAGLRPSKCALTFAYLFNSIFTQS